MSKPISRGTEGAAPLGTVWHTVESWRYGAGRLDTAVVEKSTSSSVWVNGRRMAKQSDYTMFFETQEQAADWLYAQLANRLEHLRKTVSEIEVGMERLQPLLTK